MYVGDTGPALGPTNNLSAGLLGLPCGSLDAHAEAWRDVKNVVFVKSATDIETCLGLETGSCAEYIG